jgi:cellobiose-specific phosphotransferase system component IIC
MNPKKFSLSWLLSSITMFGLSYLWHGVFLNDFARLTYPKEIFLTCAIITYLILGFLVTQIFLMDFPKSIHKKPLLRGVISGVLLGIATYVVSLVVGVSFNSIITTEYIFFDIIWQATEQMFGGIIVAFVYISIYEGNPIEVITRKMSGGY